MVSTLLEIRHLQLSFDTYEGSLNVLDGVSLAVGKATKVGLVGETGCGKSVTMKVAMGILPMPPGRIAGGEILFKSKNLLETSAKEMRRIRAREMSIVPQDPAASLNPVFKIGTQLSDGIRYSSRDAQVSSRRQLRNTAIAILEEVGLPDPERNMNSYPIQLSGGMQQRVLIAMALATSPDLLFADEPSTALDVTTQAQILRLMHGMVQDRDISILIITHNLGVVSELTDRACIMYAGQVMETAQTGDLFADPVHPYTRGLLESIPKLTGEGIGTGIKGMVTDYRDPPEGCRFRPRCDYALEKCMNRPQSFAVGKDHKAACWLSDPR